MCKMNFFKVQGRKTNYMQGLGTKTTLLPKICLTPNRNRKENNAYSSQFGTKKVNAVPAKAFPNQVA